MCAGLNEVIDCEPGDRSQDADGDAKCGEGPCDAAEHPRMISGECGFYLRGQGFFEGLHCRGAVVHDLLDGCDGAA